MANQPPAFAERRRYRKYRELARKHLGKLFDRLFTDFTGLHFHVAWAPSDSTNWNARKSPTGCSVCCRLTKRHLEAQPVCQACGPKQLARALAMNGDGHLFICRFGVRNYWLPIRLRDEILGIAYLQALDGPAAGSVAGRKFAPAGSPHLRRANARVMSRLKFIRATRLLRLLVEHVQAVTLADLRKAELINAGRTVLALEKEQSRLHQTLKRHLPAAPPSPRRTGAESQPEQIVHRLLERLELDYGKPITLRYCAREMRMNTTYLSALFSRAVGIPFKTYLTDLRLEKAKALLGDPTRTAAEVAFAVGYASENRFRSAFKKAAGLSPRVWRETMQMNPPQPGSAFSQQRM